MVLIHTEEECFRTISPSGKIIIDVEIQFDLLQRVFAICSWLISQIDSGRKLEKLFYIHSNK